jgi:aspartyl-tRNA(Asn)/glutamyl-tRNA(Gln) amidotransferase subunit A
MSGLQQNVRADDSVERSDVSAAAIVAAHKVGKMSASETARAALARAEEAQRKYNTFAMIDHAGALAAADLLDDALARKADVGALAGLPVSVKDILDVAGLPTRWGSPLFADAAPAKTDVAVVARLRAAGALIIGKTTTTEFAHSPLGTSPLTGLTLNPLATHLTCGGSSAGAGASIAAGVTRVALATDAGCSTRLPAACTGTYGLKPTLGALPHDRVPDAFGNFIHLGLLGTSVRDIALVLDALAGPHPADPQSLGRPRLQSMNVITEARRPFEGKLVLLWIRTGNSRVSADVVAATGRAAERLRQLGAIIRQEEYPLGSPDPVWRVLQQSNWAARFAASSDADRARLSPSLLAGVEEGLRYRGLDLQQAAVKRSAIFRGVQHAFGGTDYIMTPCVSAPPVPADFDLAAPLFIDGIEAGDIRSEWTPYLSLFDLSGHPAIAMPTAPATDGAPLAVQLVAPYGADAMLLAAAAAYEDAAKI